MDRAAILFNNAKPFEQIDNTPLTEGPIWNLVKIGQAVSKVEDVLRLRDFIYVCRPGARADNPDDKILIVTKRVGYFEYAL